MKVVIRNDRPRLDNQGRVVDAHEPCLRIFNGRFWLYGSRYGKLDGFSDEHRFTAYSSPDLQSWTDHGYITPRLPGRLHANPDVVYNRRTGKYVLWGTGSGYFVFTADRPEGPYTLEASIAEGRYADQGSGDFSIYIDEDDTAYRIGGFRPSEKPRKQDHLIYVERLTEDYLGGTGETSEFIASNCEGPGLFKRQGIWYALFDNTCCFCPAGSGARVYTSYHPLGPYRYRGNINRKGTEDPRQIDSCDHDTAPGAGRSDATIAAQQRRIAILPTHDGPAFVWMADRWESADDGIKGHDYTYWGGPLRFDDDGMIQPLQWQDSWTLDLQLETQEANQPRFS